MSVYTKVFLLSVSIISGSDCTHQTGVDVHDIEDLAIFKDSNTEGVPRILLYDPLRRLVNIVEGTLLNSVIIDSGAVYLSEARTWSDVMSTKLSSRRLFENVSNTVQNCNPIMYVAGGLYRLRR